MRARIYSHLHHPDRGGGASIFTDLAEGLAGRGHDVELFCAYPYYPEWTNKSGANLWRRGHEEHNGVTVVRHGLFIPKDPRSTTQRAAYEASYAASLARSALAPSTPTLSRRTAPDVIVALLPLLSSGLAAVADSRLGRGTPVWINVQDLSGRAAAAYSGRLSRALTSAEEAVLRRASVISTIAPEMTAELDDLHSPERPVMTFPNWLHASAAAAIESAVDARDDRRFDRRRPVRLLYAGNIGKKQGVEKLVQQLRCSDAPFDLEICGVGAGADAVDQIFPTDDARFRRRPFLSESDFVERLLWADCFLVPELPTDAASFLPSKLLPAVAAGTPILAIAGPDSPLREEVERHRIGAVIDWDQLHTLVRSAQSIRDDANVEASGLLAALSARARTQSSGHALDRAEHLLDTLAGGTVPSADDLDEGIGSLDVHEVARTVDHSMLGMGDRS